MLCYWRDRVPDALELLKKLAADAHPRVRLEAVRAASFFTVPEAVEVAADRRRAADGRVPRLHPRRDDEGARPVREEGARRGASRSSSRATPGPGYFLANVEHRRPAEDEADRGVYLELLFRKGVRDEVRREALADLAKLDKQDRADGADRRHPRPATSQEGDPDESVVFDLVRLLTDRGRRRSWPRVRAELEKLATEAKLPVIRQLGFVVADRGRRQRRPGLDARQPSRSRALHDLLDAMPLIRDPGLRASLYPKVEPLLDGLPPALAAGASGKGVARPLRPDRAAGQSGR